MNKTRVLAFDLVGTLLDLSSLDDTFRKEFGGSRVRREWFSEVLKLALAVTAAGGYEAFSDIAEAALKVVEERHEQRLSRGQRKEILESLRELPSFPDVKPGLRQLKKNEFRVFVLTNSGEKAAKNMVENAGLAGLIDEVLSADAVKRLKPSPEPYRMAAKKASTKRRDLFLVAAHSWDVAGAKRAGCRTAFVRRPEQILDELTPKPDLVVRDLIELAQVLTNLSV